MNQLKTMLFALITLVGVFGVGTAQAWPGHSYGPRFGVGVYIDPWPVVAYPWWGYGYSPYYAYAPVVVQQPAPTVYVEQGQPAQSAPVQVQQQQSSDWYYCRKPEGYYPYIRNCSEAWQRVPSQPPAQH